MPAELGFVRPGGDLQPVAADPLRHPAQAAVARQEATPEAEAAQGAVEVGERLLRQGGHRIAVQGKQGQPGDPAEGGGRQHAQQVEAQVQNLDKKGREMEIFLRAFIVKFGVAQAQVDLPPPLEISFLSPPYP